MKIQSLGNGTGRPVNPFETSDKIYSEAYNLFNYDNPALPLYLNGEPYMGSDVVEGERVWQHGSYGEWIDAAPSEYEYDNWNDWSALHESAGIATRQIYRITPSAPDNDKKVAEAREGIEFKGTQGPWKVTANIRTLIVSIDGIRSVCTTGNWTENLNQAEVDAENEANAQLIAAAPELLEALIEAQQQLVILKSKLTNDKMISGVNSTVELAKSAINKALGTI